MHIGSRRVIAFAWWLEIEKEIALLISSLITIGLLINYRFRLINAIENIKRQSFGTVAYGASITFLIGWLWPLHAAAVTTGVLVMAFGDGLAGLVGKKIKSSTWTIFNQKKSIAGTLTIFLVVIILLLSIAHINGIYIHPFKILGLSILSVLLEQISPWGIDNFTVPIGVAVSWVYFIEGY